MSSSIPVIPKYTQFSDVSSNEDHSSPIFRLMASSEIRALSTEITSGEIEIKQIQKLAKKGPSIEELPFEPIYHSMMDPIAWVRVFSHSKKNYISLPLYLTNLEKSSHAENKLKFEVKDEKESIGILSLILKVEHVAIAWIENSKPDMYAHIGMSLLHFSFVLSQKLPCAGKIQLSCQMDNVEFFTAWGATELIIEGQENDSCESITLHLTDRAIKAKNTFKDYLKSVRIVNHEMFMSLT